MGMPCRPLLPGYRPRVAQETLYYRLIREHYRTFLAAAESRNPEGKGMLAFPGPNGRFRRVKLIGKKEVFTVMGLEYRLQP